MIRWALRRAIDKAERDWNYDASYMRDIDHGQVPAPADVAVRTA